MATSRPEDDAQLVGVIERMLGGILTEGERDQLRASLAAQAAAIAVLRRFPLANDDAPCFVLHRSEETGNAG